VGFCYNVCLYVKNEGGEQNYTEDWRASSEPSLESGQSDDNDEAETQSTKWN